MSHLVEVAKLFMKLGFTAFGGPAVHAGLMEDEVVHRRKWIDRQHFLDLLSAVNFIPGPNSTELAIHIGYVRAGWPGLIVAGVCFIVPAVLIILPLAWMYVTWGAMPAVSGVMRGIGAVVIALIAVVLVRLVKTALNRPLYVVIAVTAAAVGLGWEWLAEDRPGLRQVPMEIILLLFGAVAGGMAQRRRSVTLPAVAPGLLVMVLEFLRIGATLFGSGYVLVAFLQAAFVDRTGLLTQQQMQDSIAIGQITPGPLLTTATFAGYVIGTKTLGGGPAMGALAAVLATAAIFLPSFIFVALLGRFIHKLRSAPAARGALDGMNAAVVAMIFLVLIKLAMTNLRDAWSIALAAAGGVAMLVWNVNPTWLILVAAAIGALAFR